MNRSLGIITLGFLMAVHFAQAKEHSLNQKNTTVNFLAKGKPSMIKIEGTLGDKIPAPVSGKLEVTETELSGSASLKLDSLDTGIELRNEHMCKNYLHTTKHASAEIVLPKQKLDSDFSGTLKLHGVEKPISGKLEKTENKLKFSFEIKVQDFGIETPSYLGIRVTDAVKIDVTTQI